MTSCFLSCCVNHECSWKKTQIKKKRKKTKKKQQNHTFSIVLVSFQLTLSKLANCLMFLITEFQHILIDQSSPYLTSINFSYLMINPFGIIQYNFSATEYLLSYLILKNDKKAWSIRIEISIWSLQYRLIQFTTNVFYHCICSFSKFHKRFLDSCSLLDLSVWL